jgi:low temperature requirement protein LtrA
MLDRCRQFIIIALGETVVATGTAIAGASLSWMTFITGAFALIGTVALWVLSFGSTHRHIMKHLDKSKDPIRSSRYAVNANMVIVAGLIAVAVANKEVIANPNNPTSLPLTLILAGGPILFLAAQGWYLWVVPKVRPQLSLIGGAVLLLVGLTALAVPAFAALILVSASLTMLMILDKK